MKPDSRMKQHRRKLHRHLDRLRLIARHGQIQIPSARLEAMNIPSASISTDTEPCTGN